MSAIADLAGKRGLVVGIANAESIAAGCAMAFRDAGAELAVTYLNEKAEPHVRPVAEGLRAGIVVPCDVRIPGQLDAVFERVGRDWGRLDFLLHSIAFAPREDLHTSLVNCSAAGFALAMDVSCHSFIRMARLAAPLMTSGGSLLTVSFYGADRVVENYNLMGPVKAALEASVRYLSADWPSAASAPMPSPPGRSAPGPRPASGGSTSCWTRSGSAPRGPARLDRGDRPGRGLPRQRCRGTAGRVRHLY